MTEWLLQPKIEQGVSQGNIIFNNLSTSDHVIKTCVASTSESGASLELPSDKSFNYSHEESDDDCFILEDYESDEEQGQGYSYRR